LELPECVVRLDKLLARSLAIALGAEKVTGLDALGREREQAGGYAPARSGQGERNLGVKLGRGWVLKFNLRIFLGGGVA
jgi:hypothetical protein